jgi:hypothetical protein
MEAAENIRMDRDQIFVVIPDVQLHRTFDVDALPREGHLGEAPLAREVETSLG